MSTNKSSTDHEFDVSEAHPLIGIPLDLVGNTTTNNGKHPTVIKTIDISKNCPNCVNGTVLLQYTDDKKVYIYISYRRKNLHLAPNYPYDETEITKEIREAAVIRDCLGLKAEKFQAILVFCIKKFNI